MGIFPRIWRFLFGAEKADRRNPLLSGVAAATVRRERYWAKLEKEDPAEWMRQMSIHLKVARKGPFDNATELAKQMREFQRYVGLGGQQDDLGRALDALPRLAEAVLPALLAGRQGNAAPPAALPAPRRRGRPRKADAIDAEAMDEAIEDEIDVDPTDDSDDLVEVASEDGAQQEGDGVGGIVITPRMMAAYVKGSLAGKQPPAAAKWIVDEAKKSPQGREMLNVIRQTTDETLFDTLRAHAAQSPDWADTLNGLVARGDWTVQVARLIRKSRPAPAAQNGHRAVRAI